MVNSALEHKRMRAAALQAYLDRMGDLLGEKEAPKADERALARAHTLAVLEEGLDPKRKRVVLQFLRESDLIPREIKDQREKIVDLSGANLRDAELNELNLRQAGLDGAFLERAKLRKAYLLDADLGGTWLHGVDLTDADLRGASLRNARLQSNPDLRIKAVNLSRANLSGADLSGANLSEAKGVTEEQLEEQAKTLQGATMPDGSEHL
jgi:uncharacterized protein YjbI with pentapeptide repeats